MTVEIWRSLTVAVASGAASSIGPCAAPRYVAIAAMLSHPDTIRRKLGAVGYLLGLLAGNAFLIGSGTFAAYVASQSRIVYVLVAAFLAGFALHSLAASKRTCCAPVRAASPGASVLLGACSSLVFSPCCAPVLFALGGIVSATAPGTAIALGCAFTIGHIGIACTLAIVFQRAHAYFGTHMGLEEALRTVGAGLMFGLAGYYAVLA